MTSFLMFLSVFFQLFACAAKQPPVVSVTIEAPAETYCCATPPVPPQPPMTAAQALARHQSLEAYWQEQTRRQNTLAAQLATSEARLAEEQEARQQAEIKNRSAERQIPSNSSSQVSNENKSSDAPEISAEGNVWDMMLIDLVAKFDWDDVMSYFRGDEEDVDPDTLAAIQREVAELSKKLDRHTSTPHNTSLPNPTAPASKASTPASPEGEGDEELSWWEQFLKDNISIGPPADD